MKSWELIKSKILKETNDIENPSILLQTGHFSLIVNKDGKLIPAIYNSIKDPRLKEFILESSYMGDFPIKTFDSAIDIISNVRKAEKISFAFIVNDWQWLHNGVYDLKSKRKEFYSKNMLPAYFFQKFIEVGVQKNQLVKSNHYIEGNLYFSENKLRKNSKKISSLCSPTSCAIEYYPFLEENLGNYNCLISYIPMSCKIPILFATINYIISHIKDIKIIHVFYDPQTGKQELSVLNRESISDKIIDDVTEDFQKMELMSR